MADITALAKPQQHRWWRSLLDPFSPALLGTGIAVVVAGFAMIGVAWGKIAPLLIVSLQMPYLVSAGFTGLGLIMLGVLMINVAVKRRDAAEHIVQVERLASALERLQRQLDAPR